jgi:hypothetical protein
MIFTDEEKELIFGGLNWSSVPFDITDAQINENIVHIDKQIKELQEKKEKQIKRREYLLNRDALLNSIKEKLDA